MKLISLNVWGGEQGQVLLDYIKQQSANTDIFCFQEVFSALPTAPKISGRARMFLFQELGELLQDFNGYFDPRSAGFDFSNDNQDLPISHGLAVFARKNLRAVNYRSEIIEQSENLEDFVEGWTKAQAMVLESQMQKFSIINFHGVAQPGNKLDTPQRIKHLKKLQLIWDSLTTSTKILCGDFNLYPDTESIKILEGSGKNLIKEFKITNTRNELSWNRHNGNKQTFADFTFVSFGTKVNNFSVPYNLVSDHLPMILEFEA